MSAHQDSADLLPCPFCGGKAKTFGPYGWYSQWGISHSCLTFYSGASEFAQGFNTEAQAITAWNTRSNTTLREQRDELLEALEKAAAWFDEYAVQHERKATETSNVGETLDRLEKSKRNQARADELRDALAKARP